MSWSDFLGGLADALGSSASRPAAQPRVERLPPRERPTDEIAEAEAETRRMMQDAAREMTRDFLDAEVSPWRKRIENAESRVIDLDSNVVNRLNQMERSLEEINFKALEAERLEARMNILIALVVALLIATLWFGLRS